MTALHEWLQPFWLGMIAHLWQSGLFIGLLALIAWTMRGTSARLLSALYWIGVLKLLLPLPLLGPISDRVVSMAGSLLSGADTGSGTEGVWTTVTIFINPVGFESGASPVIPPALLLGVSVAWLSVSAVALRCGLRVGQGFDVRRATRIDDLSASLQARVRLALSGSGVPADEVRIGSNRIGPAVRGLFRPVILLPESVIEGLESDELRAVLIHEREHLRRRDPLRYVVLVILRSALWFYPPVWWLARRIRETTEMACDEAVLNAGLPAATFCRSLARTLSLGLARGSEVSPVGILGHPVSFLRRRLERIRSERRVESMTIHRILLITVAAAALVVSLLPIAPTVSAQDMSLADDVNIPITLQFKQVNVENVLQVIASASGVEFRFVGDPGTRHVSLNLKDMRLDEALRRLGVIAGLKFRVVDPKTVEIHPIAMAGTEGVTAPRLIPEYKVAPEYPEAARKEKIQGRVLLQAVIDRFGFVSEIEPLASKPDDYQPFIASAIDAVGQWRYEPALKDGDAVDVVFTVRVEFRLE